MIKSAPAHFDLALSSPSHTSHSQCPRPPTCPSHVHDRSCSIAARAWTQSLLSGRDSTLTTGSGGAVADAVRGVQQSRSRSSHGCLTPGVFVLVERGRRVQERQRERHPHATSAAAAARRASRSTLMTRRAPLRRARCSRRRWRASLGVRARLELAVSGLIHTPSFASAHAVCRRVGHKALPYGRVRARAGGVRPRSAHRGLPRRRRTRGSRDLPCGRRRRGWSRRRPQVRNLDAHRISIGPWRCAFQDSRLRIEKALTRFTRLCSFVLSLFVPSTLTAHSCDDVTLGVAISRCGSCSVQGGRRRPGPAR